MKVRHCLYFEENVSAELEALTAAPGTSKSDIVNGALAAYFKNRGADHIEVKLRQRLDRISEQLNRVERDQQIVLETLALFVRYHLTIGAPLPAGQLSALQAVGNERFQSFVDQVSRRLAKGITFAGEIIERAEDARKNTARRK
jgi:hypothetical protein